MHEPVDFAQIGRVPAPGDNVAIATRPLSPGTRILLRQLVFQFEHTVLEGHRFAIFRIRKGETLLSWGLPFGLALRDIEPGEYVCNEKILHALRERRLGITLPSLPNFVDFRLPVQLDEASFKPGEQFRYDTPPATFDGFRRSPGRGAGTRNYVVIMGTSARTGPLARAVAARFRESIRDLKNVDGVVAVEHTEGGSDSTPRNRELALRTLAGFLTNPNVGAVFCLDYGNESISNRALRSFLADHSYPTSGLLHHFLSVQGGFENTVAVAAALVSSWLPKVNEAHREELPVSMLKLGLQCGGSDAFSGVSGNPLAGLLARDVVAWGGSANLAETSELIGAESYILANVRDFATARSFLRTTERFQTWAGWHGHSAEGNPSGGNMLRGLYNITIKSIGAARKKDPATRLDYVIDYAEPMHQPGFYFMDSPGNDLESIAGQVAAGCNMIIFTTGNGSITNFPFVPTIKVMTTTARFNLVGKEMDFNAGRYQDGESLEELGREAFDYMRGVASGARSVGERAGHAQVQLWREWRRDSGGAPSTGSTERALPFIPRGGVGVAPETFTSRSRAALIVPTSLCSGQVARIIAERLETSSKGARAVYLPHTEGCGNSSGESEALFMRTLAGYLAHPLVERALLLEHGCEKTHNDAFRNALRDLGLPESDFGWASVQLDGGIEPVTAKTLDWFSTQPARRRLGLPGVGVAGQFIPEELLERLRDIARNIVAGQGGFVVVEEQLDLFTGQDRRPTVAYGERILTPGVHRMECPTDDRIEILTGLGATGVGVMVVYEDRFLVPGNPLVPTLQISSNPELARDVDLTLLKVAGLAELISAALNGDYIPRNRRLQNTAFQITRGYTGISL